MELPACFVDNESREIIIELCKKNGIDIQLLEELIEAMQKYSGSGRRDGITSDITEVIDSFLKRELYRPQSVQ